MTEGCRIVIICSDKHFQKEMKKIRRKLFWLNLKLTWFRFYYKMKHKLKGLFV